MEPQRPIGEAIWSPRWSAALAPRRIPRIRRLRVPAAARLEENRGATTPSNHQSRHIRADRRPRSVDERQCAWLPSIPAVIPDTRPGADRLRCADKPRLLRSAASGQKPVSSPAEISLSCCPARLTNTEFQFQPKEGLES